MKTAKISWTEDFISYEDDDISGIILSIDEIEEGQFHIKNDVCDLRDADEDLDEEEDIVVRESMIPVVALRYMATGSLYEEVSR